MPENCGEIFPRFSAMAGGEQEVDMAVFFLVSLLEIGRASCRERVDVQV